MRIEETTDEVAKAMKLEDTKLPTQPEEKQDAPSAPSAAIAPELPPAMAAVKDKSTAEILADLNKSPLFMTELEDNDDTAALQAMNYEGTPSENGADFKERGNECFKTRGYIDAREFYTKGILILAAEERNRSRGEVTTDKETGEPHPKEEVDAQRTILEALYVNRAACHLELRNYRSCWTDCAGALRLDPKNVKAWYRSAKALLAVDRIEEADEACARGLALDEANAGLKAVAREIIARAEAVMKKRKADADRASRKVRREAILAAALKARGIALRNSPRPPDMEDARIKMVPDEEDPRSNLCFPAMLLYPLAFESDFIKEFGETQTLAEHLGYVLPLPWDKEGKYRLAGVECYVESSEGGLLKMGKKVPLLKVLAGGRVVVLDQVVKVFVVPSGKEAEGWVREYKEAKAKQRRG